ncbi:MAG: hypothetical protein JWM68_5594 [Verrucomicrobiales bacterium]|nr:hypothetical protein [Verrucomicrobiales bacterium]
MELRNLLFSRGLRTNVRADSDVPCGAEVGSQSLVARKQKTKQKEKVKHMKNPITQNTDGALALCMSAINGANAMGAALKHMTASVLLGLRLALLVAFNNLETGRQLLRDRRAVLSSAVETARLFATLARDILKPFLGSQYSLAWEAVGFHGSLMVPETREEMIRVLECLIAFFTANPTMEWADRNVTAAHALVLLAAINAANDGVLNQRTAVDDLMTERDEKFESMRKGLRDLINELDHLLDPLDARWLSFGFNKPGAEETPDGVDHVTVALIGPNTAALKWPAPARAQFYHVFRRVVGVDAEPVLVGSPADIDFNMEELPSNSTIEIAVSAVNDGGEGHLSPTVTIVTH